MTTFKDLGIETALADALAKQGIAAPLAIQEKTIARITIYAADRYAEP